MMTEEKAHLISSVDVEHQSDHNNASHAMSMDQKEGIAPVRDQLSEKAILRRDALRLLFGAGGIYISFLYYGSLQEDVFRHSNEVTGERFQQAWFLQFLEALCNVIVGFVGWKWTSNQRLPQRFFAITGASQVCSKAFTSLALAKGLSFPVATLAKSGKMAPVMVGQLILGGANYSVREYLQVAAIIGGTAMLSLAKKKGGEAHNSALGVMFILLSLMMDGVTGGVQKRLKKNLHEGGGHKAKPYDFMLFTNLYMMTVACVLALLLGEFSTGITYCWENPVMLDLIIKFSICSAVGQSFIFYTVAHFDPLVCTTVTTTRKICSVLFSILVKGGSQHMTGQGWAGVAMAVTGILSEMHEKYHSSSKSKSMIHHHHLKAKVSSL